MKHVNPAIALLLGLRSGRDKSKDNLEHGKQLWQIVSLVLVVLRS